MSTNEVTQFAERLALASDNVDSVMTYPHPFTNGGVVIVFDDSVDSYAQLHASVMRANPPPDDRRIVKRSDLFLLSVPNTKAMAPFDYPHNVYYLKNRGKVIPSSDEVQDLLGRFLRLIEMLNEDIVHALRSGFE